MNDIREIIVRVAVVLISLWAIHLSTLLRNTERLLRAEIEAHKLTKQKLKGA